MVDTINVLKRLLKKKSGKIPDNLVNLIFTTAAARMIENGELEPGYKTKREAVREITTKLGKTQLQEEIKRKYKDESKYDNDPKIPAKWGIVVENIENMFNIEMDKEYIGLYKGKSPVCECGNDKCVFVDGYHSRIRKRQEMVWFCEECGSSIGVHRGTDIPLGTPAGKDVRTLRVQVHKEIDRLVDSGLSKASVYKILSRKMKLKEDITHTGMFTKSQCEKALEILSSMNGGYRL